MNTFTYTHNKNDVILYIGNELYNAIIKYDKPQNAYYLSTPEQGGNEFIFLKLNLDPREYCKNILEVINPIYGKFPFCTSKQGVLNILNKLIKDFPPLKVGDKVICINNDERKQFLTIGKLYEVKKVEPEYIGIINDENKSSDYFKTRFTKIESLPTKTEITNQLNSKQNAIKLQRTKTSIRREAYPKGNKICNSKNKVTISIESLGYKRITRGS